MKKQYLLYLALLPILYILYSVQSSYSSVSPFFYGFAENKETELSHESNVSISEIYVIQGQAVKKGELLMKVERVNLEYDLKETDFNKKDDKLDMLREQGNLKNDLVSINTEILNERATLADKIEGIQLKDRQSRAIQNVMTTIEHEAIDKLSEKAALQIRTLEEQVKHKISLFEIEKNNVNRRLNEIHSALALENEMSTFKVDRINKEYLDLNITAPANGVIGNIPTKKGERVKGHTTLMTFYKENPTMVKGYVHENLLVHVNIGDSLTVASTLRVNNKIRGEVVGLGSRIVEIPERLRKMPTVKTYGREVFVEISSNNSFLQKEKVSINSDINIKSFSKISQSNSRLEKKAESELLLK